MTLLARQLASALACLVLMAIGIPAALAGGDQPAAVGKRWGANYFPNSVVYDQDGKPLHFYDDVIKGKIVVVSFIFTSCKDLCPLTIARLAEVRNRLGDAVGRDVFFVTVSIEPEKDTPAALKAYAETFQTGQGWQFLTGNPDEIKEIRSKFGELSRNKSQHNAEVVLGNDRTGEWARDSAFSDPVLLTMNIRAMDPDWRAQPTNVSAPSAGSAAPMPSLPGVAMYRRLCMACHTVGKGDRVGPDLNGVSKRRTHDWLTEFISNPEQMRQQNDATTLALSAKFKGAIMPSLGLSKADAAELIAYIDEQSKVLSAKQ